MVSSTSVCEALKSRLPLVGPSVLFPIQKHAFDTLKVALTMLDDVKVLHCLSIPTFVDFHFDILLYGDTLSYVYSFIFLRFSTCKLKMTKLFSCSNRLSL
jgi:hypothetical protein